MNSFEQLVTALAAFSITENNLHEKCNALKVLLENTNIDGYVRRREDTENLLDTLYIWENTDPDNDLRVLLKSRNSAVWDVIVMLNNQTVRVIGLRPL